MQTLRVGVLFLAVFALPLVGCEYSGPAEKQANAPSGSATAQPRSVQENVDYVARLLGVSTAAPGMPSEAKPTGDLTAVLDPGDYVVTTACAGVVRATLTLVKGEGLPEGMEPITMEYPCDTAVERFVRHAGGPITIRAIPLMGEAAVAGVTVEPNRDQRASEMEDMMEWSRQQLKPRLPGEVFGSTSSNAATSYGMSPEPGNYELQFLCEGPSGAELSVSTSTGAEVLAPVQVTCNGDVFKATVQLATGGVDIKMNPAAGPDGRYAFRFVPST